MTTGELVYVVPRSTLMGHEGWHGLRTTDLVASVEAIGRAGDFRPRAEMEHDPGWKQIIPYLVLRDGQRFFLMRRTRAGGDARLHDRYTIGVGGHLNPGDGGLDRGLAREWHEELAADFVPGFRLLGLLNDDTTDVGRVHLGVVYLADAAGRDVVVRETDKLTGEFVGRDRVVEVVDALETWSRIVLEAFELHAVR